MSDRLQSKAAQWNVTIEETRETASSLLGFGLREGRRVVLKLTKGTGDESRSGEVLRTFGGNGAVRVYEAEVGAVLLERLDPGDQLVTLVRRGADDEATKILAEVIAKLAARAAPAADHTALAVDFTPPAETPTVAQWGRGFDRFLTTVDQRIPHDLVHEAKRLYDDLVATQHTSMLLHGDLQHYNVLYDNKRGWTAIDPKGVVGELEYEVGAPLRNPIEQPRLFAKRATIERRLEILTSLLPLDYARALHWSFAQAVLSAIWDVEDGKKVQRDHPALLLALTLKPMLR